MFSKQIKREREKEEREGGREGEKGTELYLSYSTLILRSKTFTVLSFAKLNKPTNG